MTNSIPRPTLAPPRRRAFSSTEMAVVLTVIAILIAAAAPQFLSPNASAQNRLAQAAADAAHTSALIARRSLGGYTSHPFALKANASNLTFLGATHPSEGPSEVSVQVETGVPARSARLGIAVLSESGTCWYLMAVPSGTSRGVAYAYDRSPGASGCTGRWALRITPPNSEGAGTSWRTAEERP